MSGPPPLGPREAENPYGWFGEIDDAPAWIGDLDHVAAHNATFRTVLFTGRHLQLTVMCIPPGQDIGREVHPHNDQFLRIERGRARIELGRTADEVEKTYDVGEGWAAGVAAGVWHNVVNTGDDDLKLYSLYSPPAHLDGTVHDTKAASERADAIERAF